MAGLTANAMGIATALQNLLLAAMAPGDQAPYFVAVYLGQPQSLAGQSPVATIDFTGIEPRRYTMGAGRNKDKWTWTLTTWIDRTNLSNEVAFPLRMKVVDLLRTSIHEHVQLGVTDPGTTILAALLDGLRSMPDYKTREGVLYARFICNVAVYEEYNTPVVD